MYRGRGTYILFVVDLLLEYLLIVFLFSIFEFGFLWLSSYYISNSAREGARVAAKLSLDEADDTERNTTQFIVDKNRPFSSLGKAGKVYYDPITTVLEEIVFDV